MESTYLPEALRTYSFTSHGPVRTMAFFPDGRRLVTGGHFDGSARIWNLENGAVDGPPLMGHNLPILSVAVSKRGLDVVTGGPDNKVYLWNINNRQTPRVLFSGPDNTRIHSVAFNSTTSSPNFVASSGSDGAIRIWKVREDMDSTPFKKIDLPNTMVSSIQFSQGYPNLIAVTSLDKKARVYDATSGLLKVEFDGGTSVIQSLKWFPDARRLAFCSEKTIRILNMQGGSIDEKPFHGHTQLAKTLAISPHGRFIASGSNDGTLRFWNAVTRVQIGSPIPHSSPVNLVAFSPDGKSVLSVTEDSQVRLWDTNYLEVEEGLERTRNGIAGLVSFSSDIRDELRYVVEYECSKIREEYMREVEEQKKVFEMKIAADEQRFEELDYTLKKMQERQDGQFLELRDELKDAFEHAAIKNEAHFSSLHEAHHHALEHATTKNEAQFLSLNNALHQVTIKQEDDLKTLQKGMKRIMEKHAELHTAQAGLSTQQEERYSDIQKDLASIQKSITDLITSLKKLAPIPRS